MTNGLIRPIEGLEKGDTQRKKGIHREKRRYAERRQRRREEAETQRNPEKNIRHHTFESIFFSYFYFRLIVIDSFGIIFYVIKFSMSS